MPRISMDLMGTQAEWALRLPSLICGVLAIVAAYLLGRRIHSDALGLATAALVAFDPSAVDQSQQARMYAIFLLLSLLGLHAAVGLLRDPRRGPWRWVLLGLWLGLAFGTTQFGAALGAGVALATVLLLVMRRPSRRELGPWISGLGLAALVAGLLCHVGLALVLTREVERAPQASSPLAIARETVVAAKDLINLTPAGLLIYPLAAAGLVMLWRQCRISVALLVGVALACLLLLFPFRRLHPIMDPRYLLLIQPAVWLGLGMLAVGPARRSWRIAGAGVLLVYLGLQAWQCAHLPQWYPQPDRFLAGPQILRVRQLKAPQDAVLYHPQQLERLGRYYQLPIDAKLDQGFYDARQQLLERPSVPADFRQPVTWLLTGMIAWEPRAKAARQTARALARHYGVTLDEKELARHVALYRVGVLRFSAQAVQMQSVGPGEDAN